MAKFAITCVTIAALCAGMASDASARRAFSVRDVRGAYAFSFQGEIVGVGPVAAVGRFEGDGRGNLGEGVRTIAVNGITLQQTFTCSLTVDPDGTGTATCPLDVPVPGFPEIETFDFVLQDHADTVRFVGTTPGVVVLGEAERQ
jgi:hypothetical protein